MSARPMSQRCWDAIKQCRQRERVLAHRRWKQVQQGADGMGAWLHGPRRLRVIHSIADELDGQVWEHISVSRLDGAMPTWEQTRDVFWEFAGDDAVGVIVIAPRARHVNLAEIAHVWRCLTRRTTPDFTQGTGSI
jgi:hypothetical protein